jgi:hypothetical protein
MLVRRMGRPGLLGTIARTAVIAGTATATSNAISRRQARNQQQQAEAAEYEQQQYAAPAPPPTPEFPAAPAEALGDQLTKLAQLHAQGALTDDEFQTAKRQLLG